MRLGRVAGTTLRTALLALAAVVTIMPFADMILGALRSSSDLLFRPPHYFPATPVWSNFRRVFDELPMGRWLVNSLLVTGATTFVQLLTSAAAGFAFAKYRFPGTRLLFRLVLGAQMFPFFLMLIPVFMILRFWPLAGGNGVLGTGGHGLLGGYAAVILPFCVSWYGIFLMRQFMLTIPDELLDAARIDGASELGIFLRIALPLTQPALMTLGIFVFVYQWNEVIWTMTVTRAVPGLQTLPVGIYLLRGAFIELPTRSLQQAALVVSVLPTLALFLLLQRFYVRGLMLGAVKG